LLLLGKRMRGYDGGGKRPKKTRAVGFVFKEKKNEIQKTGRKRVESYSSATEIFVTLQ